LRVRRPLHAQSSSAPTQPSSPLIQVSLLILLPNPNLH
jgi:hypothetical protein